MTYDDYLLREQYSYDSRELNEDKVWLVVEDSCLISFSGGEEETKEALKRTETTAEYGWIWENDYDPTNFDYTYRLFNLIENNEQRCILDKK